MKPYRVPRAEAAYFAGLFDGEGSITLQRSHLPKTAKRKHRYTFYVLSISVALTSTSKHLIFAIAKRFGSGGVSSWMPNHGLRRAYKWKTWGWRAIRFLQTIRRDLRLKHRQADLAIQFVRMQERERLSGLGKTRRTPVANRWRRWAYLRMRSLNLGPKH
jgi:hypothetical protein